MLEKEELKSGRAWEESKGAFIRRAMEGGYTTYDREDTSYGVQRVGDAIKRGVIQGTKESFETQKELTILGVQADVIEGDVLWNKAGITHRKTVSQAATLGHGYVMING